MEGSSKAYPLPESDRELRKVDGFNGYVFGGSGVDVAQYDLGRERESA